PWRRLRPRSRAARRSRDCGSRSVRRTRHPPIYRRSASACTSRPHRDGALTEWSSPGRGSLPIAAPCFGPLGLADRRYIYEYIAQHRRVQSSDPGAPWPCAGRTPPASTERERVGLHAGIEKLDREGAIGDRAALPHELVEALAVDHTVAVGVDVDAVVGA